jgi:hypothetical protein
MGADDITRTDDEVEAFLRRHVDYDVYNGLRGELVPLLALERAKKYMPPEQAAAFEQELYRLGGTAATVVRPPRSCVAREMRAAWPKLTAARAAKNFPAEAVLSLRFAAWAWMLDDDAHAEAILAPLRAAVLPVVEAAKARVERKSGPGVEWALVKPDHAAMQRAVDRLARSWGLSLTEDEILAAAGGRHVH